VVYEIPEEGVARRTWSSVARPGTAKLFGSGGRGNLRGGLCGSCAQFGIAFAAGPSK